MRRWLLILLLGLAPALQAQDAVTRDTPALRDWFRMSELNSASGVRERLRAGQDPNALGERGQRALHWALMHESDEAFKALLAEPRTDVNALNASGEKPLWLAAMRGRLDWVQALLARGAQLERGPQPAEARAWTTLHYAATAPNAEVLAWLLKQGDLDLNAGSTNGSTPLMLALGYGPLDNAAMLLKAGADAARRNDLGLSAWDFAKRSGREEALERLGMKLPKPSNPSPVSDKL
jgi:ankyrin repeat protein